MIKRTNRKARKIVKDPIFNNLSISDLIPKESRNK